MKLRSAVQTFHVMPGLFCNFFCSHCVNDSGPSQKTKMNASEIEKASRAIEEVSPAILQFTGGEPTFYIKEINSLIMSHSNLDEVKVQITSNGWFGESEEKIHKTLSSFSRIDTLLLSFDRFHSSEFSEDRIGRIKKYCDEKEIEVQISMCITSPIEAIEAKLILDKYNVPIALQKVELSGRAKANDVSYQYPSFEPEILEKTCPNISTISYIAGKGFSLCCGSLTFNTRQGSKYYHDSLSDHMESGFYQTMKSKNFSEMLNDKSLSEKDLLPKHSSPCSICEYIWEES